MDYGVIWYKIGPRCPPDTITEVYSCYNGKWTKAYTTYAWEWEVGREMHIKHIKRGWDETKSCACHSDEEVQSCSMVRYAHHCGGTIQETLVCNRCGTWLVSKKFYSVFEAVGDMPKNEDEVWDELWNTD